MHINTTVYYMVDMHNCILYARNANCMPICITTTRKT